MLHPRALSSSVVGLFVLATFAGCTSGGGGSGGGSSASAVTGGGGSVASATGAANYSSDFDAPKVTISQPARGAYFDSSSPQVTVAGNTVDAGASPSGIASVAVNGTMVNVDGQGNFSLPVTLVNGVNIISVSSTDHAGNVGKAALSVMYCPQYRLATDDIPGAAGTRLSKISLNTAAPVIAAQFASSGTIQQKFTQTSLVHTDVRDPIFHFCLASADVSVIGIKYDPPTLFFDTVPGGINATAHFPNLEVDMHAQSYCGIGYNVTGNFTSSDAQIDLGLDVALQNGQYLITARSSSVNLQNFRWGINGIPSVITNIVYSLVKDEIQNRLADALKTDLPPAIAGVLQGLSQPITTSALLGHPVTFRAAPESLAFDTQGFQVNFTSNVTTARDPSVPVVPGSYFLPPPAGTVPQFSSTAGFYTGVNENLMNRALFASWQGGLWNMTIDTAFLQQFGANLPFQLDAQLIALFFPAIRSMITPGLKVPVAIKLEPMMQPIVEVTGQPDLVQIHLGELHLALLLDFGAGYQPFFEVALHMRAGASAAFASNAFTFQVSQNVQFDAELISASIPLNGIDMARFLSFLVPPAIQVATQSMAPIPLPTLQGLSLTNLSLYRDGQSGEFVTVSGDVR